MTSDIDPSMGAQLPLFRAEGLGLLRRPVWVLDTQRFRKVFANEAALVLWNAETHEELLSRDFWPHSQASRQRLTSLVTRIALGEVVSERWTFYPKGLPVTVDAVNSGVRLADGGIGMLVEAVQTDILPEERRAVEALHHTPVCITLYAASGEVLFRNPAAVLSYPAPDHRFVQGFVNPGEGQRIWEAALTSHMRMGDVFQSEDVGGIFRVWTPGGERWHYFVCRATADPATGQVCVLVNERDVTEERRAHDRIEYLATHDPVTGLVNRGHFVELLGQAIAPSSSGALLLIDLDGFKSINDTHGHAIGDTVLREVGARLRSVVRPDDICARLGGDEFAVILPGIFTLDALQQRAEELCLRLAHPILTETAAVSVRAGVGGAIWPVDGATPEVLQRNADLALYAAKASGRGAYRYFDRVMRHVADEQRELIEHMRLGLERGEFEVYFQPLVRLSSLDLAGFEALVRWRHPERGLLAPDLFISVAEGARLMFGIGQVVVESACRQMRACLDAGLTPGRMAVNLGSGQLRSRELPGLLLELLTRYGLVPGHFELEVPETVTLGRVGDEVIGVLSDLRDLGFSMALDDFGTGHASLTHLRRLPVDKIKIDRSFIMGMTRNAADLAIVRAVINLGHDLGMTVLAEGVETQEQADTLLKLGCDQAQGFLFGRPMPVDVLDAWMKEGPAGWAAPQARITGPAVR